MVKFAGIALIAALVVWIYSVVDVIGSEEAQIRRMPKWAWLLLVLLSPVVGSVAWLALGRPRAPRAPHARGPAGATGPAPRRPRPVGPEDSPEFLALLERRKRMIEERERRRRRDQGPGRDR